MFRTLLALVIAATLVVGSGAIPGDLRAASSVRKAAPNFTLDDSQGRPIKLSEFQGKVVVLDFWATWCHGCLTEIPWFMEFQDKYKRDGFVVLGVAMDDDGWKSVKPFVVERKINYPIVVGNQDLEKSYSVETPPVTLLIDRKGKVAEVHAGMMEKEAFEREIQNLLREGK
jgi:peroxiredoxin